MHAFGKGSCFVLRFPSAYSSLIYWLTRLRCEFSAISVKPCLTLGRPTGKTLFWEEWNACMSIHSLNNTVSVIALLILVSESTLIAMWQQFCGVREFAGWAKHGATPSSRTSFSLICRMSKPRNTLFLGAQVKRRTSMTCGYPKRGLPFCSVPPAGPAPVLGHTSCFNVLRPSLSTSRLNRQSVTVICYAKLPVWLAVPFRCLIHYETTSAWRIARDDWRRADGHCELPTRRRDVVELFVHMEDST